MAPVNNNKGNKPAKPVGDDNSQKRKAAARKTAQELKDKKQRTTHPSTPKRGNDDETTAETPGTTTQTPPPFMIKTLATPFTQETADAVFNKQIFEALGGFDWFSKTSITKYSDGVALESTVSDKPTEVAGMYCYVKASGEMIQFPFYLTADHYKQFVKKCMDGANDDKNNTGVGLSNDEPIVLDDADEWKDINEETSAAQKLAFCSDNESDDDEKSNSGANSVPTITLYKQIRTDQKKVAVCVIFSDGDWDSTGNPETSFIAWLLGQAAKDRKDPFLKQCGFTNKELIPIIGTNGKMIEEHTTAKKSGRKYTRKALMGVFWVVNVMDAASQKVFMEKLQKACNNLEWDGSKIWPQVEIGEMNEEYARGSIGDWIGLEGVKTLLSRGNKDFKRVGRKWTGMKVLNAGVASQMWVKGTWTHQAVRVIGVPETYMSENEKKKSTK